MLLAEDVERNICEAWERLRGKILADPKELGERLARRRGKALRRQPRAWCVAIRASDRRITAAHWVITPEHAMDLGHPEHPYAPIEHEVIIRTHAIRRYCHPVSFSREDAEEVAKMLGVSRGFLWRARVAGRFGEDFYKGLGGKRGKAVPLLSPKGELLDPSARNYQRPHAVWGDKWELLARRAPEEFEQTVVRRPVFRRMDGVKVPGSIVFSDDDIKQGGGEGASEVEESRTSDTEHRTEGGGEGASKVEESRTSNTEHRTSNIELTNPRAREFPDEWQHIGWVWVCPGCGKEVRTIYYPVAVMNLFDCGEFEDPAIELKLSEEDLPRRPEGKFACGRCHDVWHFSSISKDAWNQVVSHFTAGMLYGSEVQRPVSFVGERKRTRVRVMNREAPKRRKVFTRLRNGWTYEQIARDLGMTRNAVGLHVMVICREEGVANRRELARKLGFAEAANPAGEKSEIRIQNSECG